MGKGRLTKRGVEAAKPPERKPGEPEADYRKRSSWVPDGEVPGFGVRVYGGGRKVFCLRYRNRSGRSRMLRLGGFGELTAEKARDMAREHKVKILQGEDPQGERQKARHTGDLRTVGDLLTRWLDKYAREKRRGWKEDERRIDRRIRPALGRVALEDLRHPEVKAWHQKLSKSGRVEANRVVEILRAAWKWAESEEGSGLPPGLQDPTTKFGGKMGYKNREASRDRWLSMEETKRLMKAVQAEEDPFVRGAVKLFLLTGMRKRELLDARWEDIFFNPGEIRLPETKSGESQVRTLPDVAVEVLRGLPRVKGSPFAFPSPKDASKPRGDLRKPWERIRKAAGLTDVTLHDLRRTCGSYLAQSGVSLHLIAAILGHQDEKVTTLYARLSRDDERKALEALADTLAPALGLPQRPKEPAPLPDRLRAILKATEGDPEALAARLQELLPGGKAVEA